jgi:hypothetical protein
VTRTVPVGRQPVEIGRRARVIRRLRGLSLDGVAGLAGMSADHLSCWKVVSAGSSGAGIEDLANAIGCSVTDLTGQPYLPVDRATADALAVVPGIREALCDTALDDPLDLPARPMTELAQCAQQAHEDLDQDRYAHAGRDLPSQSQRQAP